MPTGWGARTTICIATLNRPQFVVRTLEYYGNAGFTGILLIGDGSVGVAAAKVREACERIPSGYRVTLLSVPGVPLQKVFGMLAERVETDFAVISGDDDYFVPQGLSAAESVLLGDPTLVAAHGMAIVVHMNDVQGIPFKGNRYPLPTLAQDSALARLQAFFADYSVSLFNLHRTSAWKRMWAVSGDLEDRAFGTEIAACAMSVVLGRTAATDHLYLVRQVHTGHYPLPPGQAWMLSPSFADSGATLVRELAGVLQDGELKDWQPEVVRTTVWNAFMQYVCHGFGTCGITDLQRIRDESHRASFARLLLPGCEHATQFWPVLTSMVGRAPIYGPKPRLLIAWGNPYVMEEVIGPLLPKLVERFTIVLLIVDFRMTPQIRELTQGWKDAGLVADVLTAPNHGWQFGAHQYMYDLLPMLRVLDFDVLVSISAMQPYERYLLECALPDKCVRIVLWPHPTFLAGNHPELARVVRQRASPSTIARIARRLGSRTTPSVLNEILRRGHVKMALLVLFYLALGRSRMWAQRLRPATRPHFGPLFPPRPEPVSVAAVAVASNQPFASTGDAPATAGLLSSSSTMAQTRTAPSTAASDSGLRRRLSRNPVARKAWHALNRGFPGFAALAYRMASGRAERRANAQVGPGPLPWHRAWPFLGRMGMAELEQAYPLACDRYLFPQFLVGRWFGLRRFDYLTQLGTDQFDAVTFFNEADTEEHKILFRNPNMYTVRYPTQRSPQADKVDAILMPFSLHSREDMGPRLYDLYARDLGIAIRECGASEVHLRPHPGRHEDWLDQLATEIRSRGVRCTLVSAVRPLADAASSYKGVIGAVSGSLRDAYLSCPHIFVVGSMALSLPGISDPKATIGFPGGIGWIEADGSYDPEIFRPSARRNSVLPDAASLIVDLYEGRWNELPARLRNAGAAR